MKALKLAVVLFCTVGLVLLVNYPTPVTGQAGATEAPTGFDNRTADNIGTFANQATHDADLETFAERDEIDDGLGPVYNAQACSECHQNPVVGAISQVTEVRAGHFTGITFVAHPGGTLINDRAIDASIQERVLAGNEVRTFRTSLNTLGDGFIEAIDSNTLQAIANAQPAGQRGTLLQVPVLEAPGQNRTGRFGWKCQHASLLSFSGDAYINEIGITNRLIRVENTSNGNSVAAFDTVPDPAPSGEDSENDIDIFARFMRATKAPPRDASATSADAVAGSTLFDAVGCNICHTRNITTAPAGTVINGGQFVVPAFLGNKIIHPFSDLIMHDVGTGDGIVQEGMAQSTRNQLRTPPLWGVRTRGRLMHDGDTLNRNEAILRHGGQATAVINNYIGLSDTNKARLIAFLNSL